MMTNEDNQIFYVVESGKSYNVFKSKEDAVKRQCALLMVCREPVALRVMRQSSLFDFLQRRNLNKFLNWSI